MFSTWLAYGDFKDLNRRTDADKVLRDKAFNITKNPKHDDYQRGLASMLYHFFDKKSSGGVATLANKFAVKNVLISNKELAEELHKPTIKKFNKAKVHSLFIDNICCVDLADIDIFSMGYSFKR